VVEHQASVYEYAARWEGTFQEHLERVRKEALRRMQKHIAESWKGMNAEAAVIEGDPVEKILAEVDAWRADLIVMGTHSKTGIERLLGGTAQKVIRRAPCPVLVTRGG
jgi:nucleotide-binding universal stress UspA family protein